MKTALCTILLAAIATFAVYVQSTSPAAAAFDSYMFFDDGK